MFTVAVAGFVPSVVEVAIVVSLRAGGLSEGAACSVGMENKGSLS
jgi:hypothetical protein